MKEDFVMRGQTASGLTTTLNFGGPKDGYGFLLIDFQLYPSNDIGGSSAELAATLTADKTAEDPSSPNFDNEGLIGVAYFPLTSVSTSGTSFQVNVINDTFVITQDLILSAIDTVPGAPQAVNWQCKFRPVKLDTTNQALTNYRQFMIFDG